MRDYDGKESWPQFKADRRQEQREKKKAKMDAGKKVKLLNKLAMERAAAAQREFEERSKGT